MTPLRPAAIEPYPRIRLRHANVARRGWVRSLTGWDTYPIDVPRPDTGPIVREVTCRTCGSTASVRVLGVSTTRTRRRVLLLVAVLGVASFAAITLSHLVVAFLPAFVLLLAGVIAYNLWRREDGVRFAEKPARGHTLDFPDPSWMRSLKS